MHNDYLDDREFMVLQPDYLLNELSINTAHENTSHVIKSCMLSVSKMFFFL
jgi:hypothetical protein